MQYKSNALCNYVKENTSEFFYFANKNIWIMLGANKDDCQPKTCFIVSEVNDLSSFKSEYLLQNEEEAFSLVRMIIPSNSNIKTFGFRYLIQVGDITNVHMFYRGIISLDELKQHFVEMGLNIQQKNTGKGINQYSSSSYHEWQRKALGNKVVFTDLDLIGFNDLGIPDVLYELKRSTKEIGNWAPYTVEPYSNDLNNYLLQFNFCKQIKLDYITVFNRYEKKSDNTQKDYLENLDIWVVNEQIIQKKETGEKQLFENIGKYEISDFINRIPLMDYRIQKKRCPFCNNLLIRKNGRYGKKDFLACPNFPNCKGFIKPIE